jgi:hypothetical protein
MFQTSLVELRNGIMFFREVWSRDNVRLCISGYAKILRTHNLGEKAAETGSGQAPRPVGLAAFV